MGYALKLPRCREITPEVSRRIAKRTEKAAYWVRRWPAIQKRLCAAPNPWANLELEDATLYVLDWLHESNQAALKARGF
jgi:hypothetical protein